MKIIIIALTLLSSTAFATVFEDIAKLPKVTTAKIRRGKTEIPVDLSQSTNSKIQDYDVLILDEGVYSTLGDFSAKYVRVIGRGRSRGGASAGAMNAIRTRRPSTNGPGLQLSAEGRAGVGRGARARRRFPGFMRGSLC